MDAIVDPSGDELWNSVGTVIDKKGVHELSPKTKAEWDKVRGGAIGIIEGANLLMIPGRHAAAIGEKSVAPGAELDPEQIDELISKKREIFDGFATALQSIGTEALRAAENQKVPELMDIGGRLDAVCEQCHTTFWYPKSKSSDSREHSSFSLFAFSKSSHRGRIDLSGPQSEVLTALLREGGRRSN